VLSYGFLINPASSKKDQKFHCDYTYTSSSLFVPLTPMTHLNAFQFLRAPLAKSRMDSLGNFGEEEDILGAEGVAFLEITQVTCRPFCLLRLLPNTPHRGVTNRGDYERVLFWVTVDDHYHELQETMYFKEVLDETVFDEFSSAKDELGDGTTLVKRGERGGRRRCAHGA
jgi:hypothetical protein